MSAAQVLAQQRAMYGEPLADRFARVLAAFHIPQSRLAAVIGLSAPMLSQLASGQRAKISNPAVYARLLRLEELARSSDRAEPAALARALDEVAASTPQLSTGMGADGTSGTQHSARSYLAVIATPADLAAAASAVPGTALADLLHAAASG